jgi:hypothetical protein
VFPTAGASTRWLRQPRESTLSRSAPFRTSTAPTRSALLGHPETATFGELLIDLEEDPAAKAVVWGLLREMERK